MAPIDDMLFIMLLLLRYYLLLFFVGRKLFSPFLTKFLQVSVRSNPLVPMILCINKGTWRIRFNLLWAPLVPMDLSIKGAQAYLIQFNMILSMDPVAIPGSNS